MTSLHSIKKTTKRQKNQIERMKAEERLEMVSERNENRKRRRRREKKTVNLLIISIKFYCIVPPLNN